MHPRPLPDSKPVAPVLRAKVVQVGNSVGIRLPASLHLQLGTEVEVTVRPANAWPPGYLDMEPVGTDFEVPEREGGPAHEERLQRLFGEHGGW